MHNKLFRYAGNSNNFRRSWPKQIRNIIRYASVKSKAHTKDEKNVLATAYNPKVVESQWYDWWEKQGYFHPDLAAKGDAFSMVLPPPNVTGTLHLGHALTGTIQDVHRMSGKPVLWVPGMDHAGIATQVVVEKKLWQEQKKTRHDIGRELFVQEVWKWKEEKAGIITQQLRKLGLSLDWSKEVFTMNTMHADAVAEAFITLFEAGLIYRANSPVNWSCVLQSAISDIEVDVKEVNGATHLEVPGYEKPVEFGVLTDFAYKLADRAVAVHPNDTRYIDLHGASVWHPFREEKIPIICDEFVDRAVKITPAHSSTDFEVANKHGLKMVSVINERGELNQDCGKFSGMKRFDARGCITDELASRGMLRGRHDHAMQIPVCSRSGDVIELLLKPQWFLKCRDMAQKALKAVEDGELTIDPPNFEKIWHQWLHEIRDWCISRQLWWGHQIPAFECSTKTGKNMWVAARDVNEAKFLASTEWNVKLSDIKVEQDVDVLDTWFSSALLPFSSMGWPRKMEKFYPLTLMETGHDILFFWVARMVMMGTQLTGQLPFKKILLHGIICDAHGRKMSKSLGNVVLPEDIITGITLQACKYALLCVDRVPAALSCDLESHRNTLSRLDKWILSRAAHMVREVHRGLEKADFHIATTALRTFIYGEICDFYLWEHWADSDLENEVQAVIDVIAAIRHLRTKISSTKEKPTVHIVSSEKNTYGEYIDTISKLSGCREVVISSKDLHPDGSIAEAVGPNTTVYILVTETEVGTEEQSKLKKKQEKLQKELEKLMKTMAKEEYKIKAPQHVQESHSLKIQALENELKILQCEPTILEKPWLQKSNLEKWLKTPIKEIECMGKNGKGENFLSSIRKVTVTAEDGRTFALDLMVSGFKMHDRVVGLNLEQCLLVMRTLAKFHAASAVLHERDPKALDTFDLCFLQEDSLQEPYQHFISGFALTLAEELESWDEEWHQYIPKLELLAKDALARTKVSATRKDTDLNVLVHGDFWTNNMLFRGEASGLRFVDFQLACFSSPVLDLHYFIATSALTEVRIHHIQRLFEEYHRTLNHTLVVLGYGKHIPTLQELQEEFDRRALYGIFSLIGPYTIIQSHPESGLTFDDLLTGKNPGTSMYGDIFKSNVKIMLPWLTENGHSTPWLEKENLQKWLKTPVKEIESEQKNSKGDNYLSSMQKLTVKTEDGRTFQVVVKCRLLSGTTADVFGKTDIFRKEVEFYRRTSHAIQDILNEVFPDDEEPIAPKCYYACEDFLVLEDLVASGFKMHNRRVGLNLEQCLLVMRRMAKLHAASVILHIRNPHAFKKFDASFFQEPSLQEPFGNFIKAFAQTLIEELESWGEEWHQYIPKLEHLNKCHIVGVGKNIDCEDSKFNVFTHGDLWTNNMLLNDNSGSIRFVDYQLGYFSTPALDLLYFIATSATSLHYNKYIPTLEELYQELDRRALYGLYCITGPHAVMKCDPECGFSFDDVLNTAKTPGPSMYDETYKKCLKKENLQKWLKTPVKEVLLEGGNAKGENYLSTMRRLTVKADDGRTFPLVIKCRLLEGTAADVFQKSDIFKKEVEFYGKVVYALQDVLKDAFPDDEPMFPKCYYACEDFLVLEDLSPSGYKTQNRRVGLNLEQCQLVMRLALTLAEELDTWDEEWHKYIPKLRNFAENSIARVRENSTRVDTDFNVLLHADVWTNNILFRDGTTGIRFVDFQVTHYSSPVLDLHYFIATSPTVDVRANYIQDIIKEYHKTLTNSLLALGYNKYIPTLEELHQEIDKKSVFGLYALCCPYAVMQCDPDCGFSFDDILATGKTPGPSIYDETYKKNIKVLLPWLAVKGAFEIDDKPMFPKCYYACEDFLVMEDLLASGFKMYDRRVGFDLEKCLLILRTLAKLHAASVILHERNPRSLDQFDINFLQEPSLQTPMGNFITGFALTLAEELKTWDKEWHQYIPKLKLLAKNSIAGIRDNSSRRDGDFNVLLHGDLWTNNLLLRESTAGIRILDFQLANYGSPVIDLHYFFATSATEDVRVNHFHRLMEEYHKSLFETLMAMNYNKHVPTLEELHQEFDRASLYGLFSIIGPYAVMQCDTEIGFSFDETLSTGNTPGPCVFGDNYKRNIKLALPFLSGKGGFDNVL
ncbi:hypothetical protein C0J52_09365 [Blattella germanica]|nr:hypothetical protein C0J52_09365 [Blattella germanica]